MSKSRRKGGPAKLPRETRYQRATREMETFGLMPWEIPPSLAGDGDPPPWASVADRESWSKAQRLRKEIREKYGDEYFDYLPDDKV